MLKYDFIPEKVPQIYWKKGNETAFKLACSVKLKVLIKQHSVSLMTEW